VSHSDSTYLEGVGLGWFSDWIGKGRVVLFHPTWIGMGWIWVGWVELGWDGSGWVKRSGGLRSPRMPEVVSRVINNTTGPAPGFTLRRRQCSREHRRVVPALASSHRSRHGINRDLVEFAQ